MATTPMNLATLGSQAAPDGREPPQLTAITRFIAEHATPYLQHYEMLWHRHGTAMNMRQGTRLPFAFSWLWPAFMLTIPWMFYRKMYTGGIILVALPVFLDHLLPGSLFLGSGFLIAVTAGLCGKSWYLEHVVRRLAKAPRLYASEAAQSAYLARARGVSLSAGIFGGLIQIVSGTVIILDLLPPRHF